MDPEHGVYPHHCRNVQCDCNGSGSGSSTYFSKKAQEKVKELLLNRLELESTESQLKLLTGSQSKLTTVLTDDEEKAIGELKNDKTYLKEEEPKTIGKLIKSYIIKYDDDAEKYEN